MGLFGKKTSGPQIPPVEDAGSDLLNGGRNLPSTSRPIAPSIAPSYRTEDSRAAAPYANQGGSYASRQQQQPAYQESSRYGQNAYESSRKELFRDARAPKDSFGSQSLDKPYDQYGNNSGSYGNEQQQQGQMQDEDEEVDAIKQQMRFTKQESLASTRNALRAAREAEETARNTLVKLGDQTERIANTERALDMTKAYNDRAQDEAKEIQSLNRSIFRPNFSMNKQKKRDAEERRILDRHHSEREQREDNRRQVYESRERVEGTFRAAERQRQADDRNARFSSQSNTYGGQGSSKLAGRSKYQFEADEEDEQVEQELDENLNEIGALSKRLNLLARSAGDEVRAQNVKLGQLNDKTDIIDSKIFTSTQRLARIK